MNRFLLTSLVCIVITAVIGCAPPTTKSTDPAYVPSFKYVPATNAVPGSAEVAFSIVNASYSTKEAWSDLWPFTEFSKNMSLDFQQMLSSRGFTTRGPFGSYEELTYPDKKGSDLVLEPTLELTFDLVSHKPLEHVVLLGTNYYTMNGEVAIAGRVTLSILESLSKERMWFKSIDIPREVITFTGEYQYQAPSSRPDPSDPGIIKSPATSKALESIYAKIMQTAWTYLDPEEMRLIKKQAEEIKKKKIY